MAGREASGSGGLPPGPAGSLPCLSCNISTGGPPSAPLVFPPASRRTAAALALNVQGLAARFGLSRLGFLTLTFADDVRDRVEALRRFNSLRTHVIASRYAEYIRVLERHASGRIHFHLLLVLDSDIRSGVDFGAFSRCDYRSASRALRSEWSFWRRVAPRFGFGRTELLPIKSSSEAVAFYVGKYISKHFFSRRLEDKSCRLVGCSSGARFATTRFTFVCEGSARWRSNVALFCSMLSERLGHPVSYGDLPGLLGDRWAFHNRHFINSLGVGGVD